MMVHARFEVTTRTYILFKGEIRNANSADWVS